MTPYSNKLIHESSPYLLQHAYNPVDWHPWNEETLKLAKESNRMMLISIGYSACHWCHVMERESFEDESIAEIMNTHFICIKVDREERPDVDHFFMEAVQLIGGRGGWPLNCFALPDGRPFWGGTYFRQEQWKSILMQIAELWNQKSSDLVDQADQLIQALKSSQGIMVQHISGNNIDLLRSMVQQSKQSFDPLNGGDVGAPKFPMPGKLQFLLLLGQNFNDALLINHVELSLDKMASGGIYDQIGGGFARYSVDERWHVPHFEKMLYDNAQLISLYANAFRLFKKPLYEEVVRNSIHFLINNMRGSEGAFYSAIDADSEGVEGKFYVWEKAEFDQVLGEDAKRIGTYYGIDNQAQWEKGLNVLVTPYTKKGFCDKYQLETELFETELAAANSKLLAFRNARVSPGLDDKRLVSWNALLISALTIAFNVFGNERWLQQAQLTTNFILSHMRQDDGSLMRSWKSNKASINAFLDDYSFLINALIHLYESDGDEAHLHEAKKLCSYAMDNFFTENEAIFEFTANSQNDLEVRPREIYDNVLPSSNASICLAMVKLGMLFDDQKYITIAEAMLARQKSMMKNHPSGFSHWAQALWLLEKQPMIIIGGRNALAAKKKLYKLIPIGVLTVLAKRDSSLPIVSGKPFTGTVQYYFCDRNGCRLAVDNEDELLEIIKFG